MQSTQNPELERLEALVGEWTTEATHPAFPGTVIHGRAVAEWLEGERFLILRSQADHPEFPDAITIIGAPTEGLSMHYFDSRGIHRVYAMSLNDGIWRFLARCTRLLATVHRHLRLRRRHDLGPLAALPRRLDLGRRPRNHLSEGQAGIVRL